MTQEATTTNNTTAMTTDESVVTMIIIIVVILIKLTLRFAAIKNICLFAHFSINLAVHCRQRQSHHLSVTGHGRNAFLDFVVVIIRESTRIQMLHFLGMHRELKLIKQGVNIFQLRESLMEKRADCKHTGPSHFNEF
jgi:hypothetical protein